MTDHAIADALGDVLEQTHAGRDAADTHIDNLDTMSLRAFAKAALHRVIQTDPNMVALVDHALSFTEANYLEIEAAIKLQEDALIGSVTAMRNPPTSDPCGPSDASPLGSRGRSTTYYVIGRARELADIRYQIGALRAAIYPPHEGRTGP